MITLIVIFLNGIPLAEPISPTECHYLIEVARYVRDTGQSLTRDEGTVAMVHCGGDGVVVELPSSTDRCEVEAQS